MTIIVVVVHYMNSRICQTSSLTRHDSVNWANDVNIESCRISCQFFSLHTQYLRVDGLLFVSVSGLQCRYSAGDFGASASFDGRPDVPGFAQLLLEL